MTGEIAYTVTATFQDPLVAQEWVGWLKGGHIREVLACGARDAEIIRLDAAECIIVVRYHFPTRQSFSDYEKNHAPRLRAEGLKKFPAERGIAYQRSVGMVETVVHDSSQSSDS